MVGDASICVPDVSTQLVVVGVHLIGDRAKRLVWVDDVRRVGEAAGEQEWRAAFDLADRAGLGWALDRALDYAERLLGFRRPRPRRRAPKPRFLLVACRRGA